LAVVTKMLESGGTGGVQLAAVAKRARVSMTTIYKYFGSRDELIVAAIQEWMDTRVYRTLAEPVPEEPFDALMCQFRRIFEPWERHPRMAEAFMRARMGPGGHRLLVQGQAASQPIARIVLTHLDPELGEDVASILENVTFALVHRFAVGELRLTDILPTLERTLTRLIGDSKSSASVRRPMQLTGKKGLSVPAAGSKTGEGSAR
jgi:AcrR family transcriptional regulator